MADEVEFVASMRRVAEEWQGPEAIRIMPVTLLRLVEIAEKAQTERLKRFVR